MPWRGFVFAAYDPTYQVLRSKRSDIFPPWLGDAQKVKARSDFSLNYGSMVVWNMVYIIGRAEPDPSTNNVKFSENNNIY